MEEVEMKLLSELQANCKQSLRDLSHKLGIPMSTIHDKIRKFEKNGIIKKFSAIIDGSKLGFPITAFVLVSVRPTSKKLKVSQQELTKAISKYPQVQEVYIITGEWDILVKMKGKDLAEIGDLVVSKIREMHGVDKTFTINIFETAKETSDVAV
ncbi:Lrp/AsnC family transcriptional regulator [Candidatus Micrarchaeota archaeon]|nr:Lrp/AsnC family transcriptional regulator [Candidatus Micrarchaeota archaeon]